MPSYNNGPVIKRLGKELDSTGQTQPGAVVRECLISNPCLLERLPSSSFLQREAEEVAPRAILRQLRRSPTPPPLSPELTDADGTRQHHRQPSTESQESSSPTRTVSFFRTKRGTEGFTSSWKEPQPFEILRAVERKDLVYLMEVRDRAFHLLLRKSGDVTPLLHAMRIGQSHRDVAIVLLGAFSRYINHLDDTDLQKPATKTLLKALRANLKLAIDVGLAKSQSDLTASFMQTLIMSEGDKWIYGQISNVSLALRAGTRGEPVKTADAAVRKFATKELGKAELIASLEDYVANATADLIMLSAWSIALESIQGEPIPFAYFARDDRVYKAFIERLDKHKSSIHRSLSRRLKWQFRVLQTVLEGRSSTHRRKIEILAEELDEGEGV